MAYQILMAIGGGTLHYTGNDETNNSKWAVSFQEAAPKRFASKDEADMRAKELQAERDNEKRYYVDGRRCTDKNGLVWVSETLY